MIKRNFKFILGAVLGLVIILSMAFMNFNNTKTIEEVLNDVPGARGGNILHEEKTGSGTLVFYNRAGEDSLYADLYRRNLTGWKYVYGGVEGDIKKLSDKFGISYVYYPNIKRTPFPLYFGIVGNPAIKSIIIKEKKRKVEVKARIIDANNTRIWLLYMNKLKGSDFEIVGLSKEGTVLTRIEDSIYPYYAEQKPISN